MIITDSVALLFFAKLSLKRDPFFGASSSTTSIQNKNLFDFSEEFLDFAKGMQVLF